MKKNENQSQNEIEKQKRLLQVSIERISQITQTDRFETLETTPRFLKDAVRGAGFKFDGCIAEFVDNSIDAAAKNIIITPIEKSQGIYDIIISDDGVGIPSSKAYDVVKKIGYGNVEDYSSIAISNFGLGMKFAIINLCTKGTAIIESIHEKKKTTIYLSVDGIPHVFDPIVEETREKSGTKVFIPNVKTTSNQISSLIKFLGCTYYPHIANGNKLNISVLHKDEFKNVGFYDPLYRHVKQGVQKNDSDCEINGFKIYLRGRTYDYSFPTSELSPWDIKQGSSDFSGSRSGIYFRLGGRYITLGHGLFHSQSAQSQQWRRARIRIEVEIDRALIPILGVGFNKSLINFDETSPDLKPFIDELDPMVKWANKIVTSFRKEGDDDLLPEEEYQKEEVEKNINARRRRNPLDIEELNIPEAETKDTSKGENDQDQTSEKTKRERPDGLTYNKKNIELLYKSLGTSGYAFNFDRINKKLVVTLNKDHNFYHKYYVNLPAISQEVCITMVIAICDSIYMAKLEIESGTENYMWDDNMLNYLSTRLNKYLSI